MKWKPRRNNRSYINTNYTGICQNMKLFSWFISTFSSIYRIQSKVLRIMINHLPMTNVDWGVKRLICHMLPSISGSTPTGFLTIKFQATAFGRSDLPASASVPATTLRICKLWWSWQPFFLVFVSVWWTTRRSSVRWVLWHTREVTSWSLWSTGNDDVTDQFSTSNKWCSTGIYALGVTKQISWNVYH